MGRRNLIYIGVMIFVILFVFLIMLPPVIDMLEYLNTDMTYRILILVVLFPGITILLMWATLSYTRTLITDREKEKVEDIITPGLTEQELFEESLFENEKLRVLQVIKTFAKIKGREIPLETIRKKTGFNLDKIEDMIYILMGDELLDGEIKYPEDNGDPILILPEKKEIKVSYINDSKNKKEEDQEEESDSS